MVDVCGVFCFAASLGVFFSALRWGGFFGFGVRVWEVATNKGWDEALLERVGRDIICGFGDSLLGSRGFPLASSCHVLSSSDSFERLNQCEDATLMRNHVPSRAAVLHHALGYVAACVLGSGQRLDVVRDQARTFVYT